MEEEEWKKMERARGSEEKEDRLSDLPDYILHYILSFLDTKFAVQTSVLSKRWEHLWSYLPILKLHYSGFNTIASFNKFVSWCLSHRDGSTPVHDLEFWHYGRVPPALLKRFFRYAVSHDIQQLSMAVSLNFTFPPSFLTCKSLTTLRIENWDGEEIPNSLDFPMLATLELRQIRFPSGENGCLNPFSNCSKLKTLILDNCSYPKSSILCISAPQVANLTFHHNCIMSDCYNIKLSSPNLSSFVFIGFLPPLLSAEDIPFLDKLEIQARRSPVLEQDQKSALVLLEMLTVLSTAKSITLSASTVEILSCNHDFKNIPDVSFCNLKSWKLNMCGMTASRFFVLCYLLLKSPPCAEVLFMLSGRRVIRTTIEQICNQNETKVTELKSVDNVNAELCLKFLASRPWDTTATPTEQSSAS
ncbi:F-box family protein [Quillaja saponaria]|uniref:F-box family protein n=1 Tax=Quillaja saponaria TaxID=32244 RepID=A0AAD7KUK3_QUISA|nr:F-box family protein [Quillaja saponaria]KAJ7946042.1 F-box family protein [Quillaja saponaria]